MASRKEEITVKREDQGRRPRKRGLMDKAKEKSREVLDRIKDTVYE